LLPAKKEKEKAKACYTKVSCRLESPGNLHAASDFRWQDEMEDEEE